MTVFFTSDTHFSHARIIELCDRPFRDVQHMNEMLVENWNDIVSPDDTVYHLGDVALGQIEESLGYISRLNGDKVLVTGNHDRNFRGGKKSRGLEPGEWDQKYVEAGFRMVVPQLALYGVAGLPPVWLSHFPYTGDSHGEERYREFRPKNIGVPLIHGHTHFKGNPLSFDFVPRKVAELDEDGIHKKDDKGKLMWKAGKMPVPQVHVGVDAWDYRPVSAEKVLELLS